MSRWKKYLATLAAPKPARSDQSVLEGTVDDNCHKLGKTCEELLNDLRQLGHGIVFDTSQVPPEHYDAHKQAGFELTCTILMMNEGFRAGVGLHEAAHAEYAERMGYTFIRFEPPFAWCKPDGSLHYSNARVHIGGEKDSELLDWAKMSLAAGIVVETMTGQPTERTVYDEDDLEALFAAADVTAEDRVAIREQARADILKDLRSPAFRKALWKRAKFYQRILEHAIFANREPAREAA